MLISDKQLRSQLAMWVCRQHPYRSVEGVDAVGRLIDEAAAADGWDGNNDLRLRKFEDWRDVEKWLRGVIWDHPQMAKWNTPANEHTEALLFVSRYDVPDPASDFIDLDALVRNIALYAWRESERDHAADQRIDTVIQLVPPAGLQ